MIVTVGGVYAQWTYSESEDMVNEASGTIIVDLQPAVNKSSTSGSFEVLMNTVKIEIQDNYTIDSDLVTSYVGTDQGDYIPELYITGQIVILYTFYNADQTLPDNISMTHTLTPTADMKYNGVDIFNIEHNGENITSKSKVITGDDTSNEYHYTTLNNKWSLGSDSNSNGRALTIADKDKYIFIVDAASLMNHLSINNTIKLETLNEYHAFESVIGSTNLLFTINDSTISTASEE